jgi:uncharacterized membrane protein
MVLAARLLFIGIIALVGFVTSWHDEHHTPADADDNDRYFNQLVAGLCI